MKTTIRQLTVQEIDIVAGGPCSFCPGLPPPPPPPPPRPNPDDPHDEIPPITRDDIVF